MNSQHLNTSLQKIKTPANQLSGIIVAVGVYTNQMNDSFLVVKRIHSALDAPVAIPLTLLAHGKHTALSEFLIKHRITEILNIPIKAVKDSLIDIWKNCENNQVSILDCEGFHEIYINDLHYPCFVKGGRYYLPKQPAAGTQIVLIGAALKKNSATKNIKNFNETFSKILKNSPRLLITLLVSLSAYFYRAFNISPLSLMLVGETSIGKSVIQRFVGYVVKGNPELHTVNATTIGLHDYCSEQGTSPALLEDAHGKNAAEPITSIIMDVGNGATRLRSTYATANTKTKKPIKCTLIISAEKSLNETAKDGNIKIHNGVFSRIFVIHSSTHGMFESLCGFDKSVDLVNYIENNGSLFSGVLGEAMVSHISENWDVNQERWKKFEKNIREKILLAANIKDDLDGQSNRILNGLVFCSFIGRIASHNQILNIPRKNIDRAFGSLFREFYDRYKLAKLNMANSSSAEETIKYVRNLIKHNQKGFLSFKNYLKLGDDKVIGLYYEGSNHGDAAYLIKPEAFKSMLGDRFNRGSYQHLLESGFLKTNKNRGNQYLKRLPDGSRSSFIAIAAAILDA